MSLHSVALKLALLLIPAIVAVGRALGEMRVAGMRLCVGGVLSADCLRALLQERLH
jgi:putative effector of murein hydrolase LrgA (UPF0299 family)